MMREDRLRRTDRRTCFSTPPVS